MHPNKVTELKHKEHLIKARSELVTLRDSLPETFILKKDVNEIIEMIEELFGY